MELELKNGDYLADGVGGLRRVGGREALLQRVLFRLTARRGSFPFREDLGSRLWELGRAPGPERRSAARQYVAEALQEEPDLTARLVKLTPKGEGTDLAVYLEWRGEGLTLQLPLERPVSSYLAEQVDGMIQLEFSRALSVSAGTAWGLWLIFVGLSVAALKKSSRKMDQRRV